MPILTVSTSVEFHDYIQKCVRDFFPDWETYQGTDRYPSETPFKHIKCIKRPLTPGCRLSAISRRISTLLEIIGSHDIPVKIKVCGVVKCLSDQGVLAEIIDKTTSKAFSSSAHILGKLTERKFDSSITLMCKNPTAEEIENKIGVLAYMIVFSVLHRKDGAIMFPKQNKG